MLSVTKISKSHVCVIKIVAKMKVFHCFDCLMMAQHHRWNDMLIIIFLLKFFEVTEIEKFCLIYLLHVFYYQPHSFIHASFKNLNVVIYSQTHLIEQKLHIFYDLL